MELTDHVKKRMAERGITEGDIQWALRRRVGSPKPGEPGSIWVMGQASGGRILKVLVASDDMSRVITAAWPGEA